VTNKFPGIGGAVMHFLPNWSNYLSKLIFFNAALSPTILNICGFILESPGGQKLILIVRLDELG
jgi:hypothetical protein